MRLFTINTILFFSIVNTANAQLNKFEAMYYQNQYLGNPAMAGLNEGLNVNLGFQRPWNNIPGNPVMMYATGEYNRNSRSAYGLNFSSDRAGLITNSRILGTFAYHLPLDAEEKRLNFGLSLGARFLSLDKNKIIGNIDDPSLQNFNDGGALDGDFGISYTTKLLTVQASVPNLNNTFFEKDNRERRYVDSHVFYSAISYKIYVSSQISDFSIEPLAAYRVVRGYKDIIDAGANFTMLQYNINVSAMYHSNEVISGSFGINLDKLGIFFSYSSFIGNTGAFANDGFELGLRYNFLK